MDKAIQTKDGYYIWKKGDDLWINNWFKTKEFACKCTNKDCVDQKIAVELIERLTAIREYTKSPMRISSGFRCSKHQEAIRNSGTSTVVAKKSTHEKGDAADISVSSLTTLNLLLVAEKQFKSIGIANNFLHVDLRDDKTRRWKY
jgi:uncharacterized protein YcbK (DUF882 family)